MAKQRPNCSVPDCNKPRTHREWCKLHWQRWYRTGDPLHVRRYQPPAGQTQAWIEAHLLWDSDECLFWPFGRANNGYGKLWYDNHTGPASRFICRLAHGDPPTPEHQAAHSCGRGHEGCVSPKHLRWATHAENEADKLLHGTRARGPRNGWAKLSVSDVRRIRELAANRVPQRQIGRMFGVSGSHVGGIIARRFWAHLE